MTDLQLALLGGGAVFVLGVIVFNFWQERRARGRAERAFKPAAGDALLDTPKGAERREPTLGGIAQPVPEAAVVPMAAPLSRPQLLEAADELEATGGPAAQISNKIDTVAVILADDPIMREQLDEMRASLGGHATPILVEGIVDEQWHPIDASPRQSWREVRVALQLASRAGPVGEEEVERFNAAIAAFAGSVNAVSQRESPAAAAQRARDLDRFCAEADIEVALNVVGQFGASLPLSRVKQLALENGLSETASGELVSFGDDGEREFVARPMPDAGKALSAATVPGLTLALDLPQVRRPLAALEEMVRIAHVFAQGLPGQVVDDNRRALSDAGIASIRRSVEGIVRTMEERGIAPGGLLARRLFA